MTQLFPAPPAAGSSLLAARPSPEARRLLALRKSANKRFLGPPGPSPEAVDELLQVAMRVPDHRKLAPWRFVVFEGSARASFAAETERLSEGREGLDRATVDAQAQLLRTSPVTIAVVSSPDRTHRTPVWEQELSAGAACMNLLIAANAAGWAGVWLTDWIAYDEAVARVIGLSPQERLAGFVYLGTASEQPQERLRPELAERVVRWQPQS